jgi:Initiator Replication protein
LANGQTNPTTRSSSVRTDVKKMLHAALKIKLDYFVFKRSLSTFVGNNDNMTHSLMPENARTVARIENELVLNYQYVFSAREQKAMLFLIANLEKGDDSVTVSIKDIENILKEDDKKWGESYTQIKDLCFSLLDKKFFHKSKIKYKGAFMEAGYNWFQSVVPLEGNNVGTFIKFRFSQDALPFLLQLREYVQINIKEIKHMKSGHSIRLFQLLKAKRNKNREFTDCTEASYTINDIKTLLGVEDKYPRFNNFRQKILDVAMAEINEKTSIFFDVVYKYQNTREKKIDHLTFKVFDSKEKANLHNQKQQQLAAHSEKKVTKAPKELVFEFAKFKKKYAKVYAIVHKKSTDDYNDMNKNGNMLHLDKLIEQHTEGVCKLYFDCYVTKTNAKTDALAMLQKILLG